MEQRVREKIHHKNNCSIQWWHELHRRCLLHTLTCDLTRKLDYLCANQNFIILDYLCANQNQNVIVPSWTTCVLIKMSSSCHCLIHLYEDVPMKVAVSEKRCNIYCTIAVFYGDTFFTAPCSSVITSNTFLWLKAGDVLLLLPGTPVWSRGNFVVIIECYFGHFLATDLSIIIVISLMTTTTTKHVSVIVIVIVVMLLFSTRVAGCYICVLPYMLVTGFM